jgi:hypothetical protein
MDKRALTQRLRAIRLQLVPHWTEWAQRKNRPEAADGKGLCRYTAVALSKILGKEWKVAGGEALVHGHPGGFFDGLEWHGHYWVTNGRHILDITANQFGAPDVIVTEAGDVRYHKNYTQEELSEHIVHVRVQAIRWARTFQALPVED